MHNQPFGRLIIMTIKAKGIGITGEDDGAVPLLPVTGIALSISGRRMHNPFHHRPTVGTVRRMT
jgi:hypothetical protein